MADRLKLRIKDSQRVAGLAFAFVSASCFGTLGYLSTQIKDAGISLESMLFWRLFLAGFILWVIRKVHRGTFHIKATELFQGVLLGGIGYFLQAWCYFNTVTKIGAGMAAILLYTFPGFLVGMNYFIFGEKLNLKRLLACRNLAV